MAKEQEEQELHNGEAVLGEKTAEVRDRLRAERDAAPQGSVERAQAESRLRIFFRERDNTGSLVTERFGQDLVADLTLERKLELDAEGLPRAEDADTRTHFLLVNMGELDRLNAEKGHAGGDVALEGTARDVELIVVAGLSATDIPPGEVSKHYEVYRYAGNEFMIRLKDVAPDAAADIQRALAEHRVDVGSDVEPVPLAASHVSMAEAVDLLREREKRLPESDRRPEGEEAQADRREAELPRGLIDVIKRASEFQSEMLKFERNALRTVERIRIDGDKARPFFELYMGKAFAGTRFSTFEKFQELAAAFPEGPAGDASVRAALVAPAAERAIAWMDGDRQTSDSREEALFDAVAARYAPRAAERPAARADRGAVRHERTATPVADTQGRALIAPREAALRETLAAAGVSLPLETVVAEVSRGKEGEKTLAAAGVELTPELVTELLGYQEERSRRDTLTGLLKRREFYETLREDVKEGREPGVLFVDMAFLKYFDKVGGKKVGNLAIRKAAEILEVSLADAGVKGEIYRYGGDEFTVRFETPQGKDLARAQIDLVAAIQKRKEGVLIDDPAAASAYTPEALSFNFGYADRAITQEVFQELVDAGAVPDELVNGAFTQLRKAGKLPDGMDASDFEVTLSGRTPAGVSPEAAAAVRAAADRLGTVAKFKAELQTRVADQFLERGKAIDRFDFFREGRMSDQNPDHVATLMRFSEKALLGAGEQVAAGSIDRDAFARLVEQKLEVKRAHALRVREIGDFVVATRMLIKQYEQQISRLDARDADQRGHAARLEKQVSEYRSQMDAVRSARGNVDRILGRKTG